ncbi:MAG: hypothetical protein K0R09_242 [Clostridiales bacterium]|nr:hypothetical protein [Clostridiales bacterium]
MKKKVISVFLVLFMVFSPLAAMAETGKDETVYINLNHDGSVNNIKVVNHVFGIEGSEFFTDYGKYTNIKNLNDETAPSIDGNILKWPLSQYKNTDLYYEGTVNKESPIEVVIKYYLDGKELKGEELAGKSGHLKVVINIKYTSEKNGEAPKLMTQIQFPVDMDIFKNIKVKGGSKVVVGSSANVTFVSLPGDTQSFEVEMDGIEMELKSISISAVPSEFALPGSVKEGLNMLTDGLAEIEENAGKLENGMGDTITGTKALKTGMVVLGEGLSDIYRGSSKIYEESKNITSGMEEFHNGLSQFANDSGKMIDGIDAAYQGLDKLYQGSEETYKGVGGLYDGSRNLSKGTKELSNGITELKEGHSQLVALAQELLKSTDPRVRGMAQGIIQEGKALEELSSGATQVNGGASGLEGGIGQLYGGLGEYNKGFSQVQLGMKEISEKSKQFPTYLGMLSKNYGVLKAGTNSLFKGYGDINSALGEISKNVSTLPTNTQKLVDGRTAIKTGINKLNKGIKKVRISISDNLGELIGGADGKSSYTSFMDNERNKNSSVQFVMQTPSVEMEEVKKVEVVQEKKKSFFDRLMGLFKKD